MSKRPSKHQPVTSRPIAVDLFAGAGGLSLGLEQAGFDIGAAVEMAPGPVATHLLNFPKTPVIAADIRTVTASAVMIAIRQGLQRRGLEWDGVVTLCAGGPPCQGYSVGGHRRTDDIRNELVHEFQRMVIALRSRYFVMENVPGLLLPDHAATIKKLTASFQRSGYEIAEPIVFDAKRVGVPQSRRRVLLFGWRDGECPVDVVTFQQKEAFETNVAQALNDLPEVDSNALLTGSDTWTGPKKRGRRSHYAKLMQATALDYAYPRDWDGRTLTGCARTEHSSDVVERFRATEPGQTEPISRYRRLSPDGHAPTLRAGTGPDHGSHTPPRPIHHKTPRVISVREAARLQSFPDWFQFAGTKWHAWQEIGNSVPPFMARAIGNAVVEAARITLPAVDDSRQRDAGLRRGATTTRADAAPSRENGAARDHQ